MTLNYGSPGGIITLWADFLLDNVSESGALSNWLETTDNASQNITNKHGGWWRHTIATGETDDLLFAGEVAWEVDEGFPLIFQTRLVSSDVSKSAIFVGFHEANTVGSSVLPIHNENASQTVTSGADTIGFFLDCYHDESWTAVASTAGRVSPLYRSHIVLIVPSR